jgi:hypothetical protein
MGQESLQGTDPTESPKPTHGDKLNPDQLKRLNQTIQNTAKRITNLLLNKGLTNEDIETIVSDLTDDDSGTDL